MSHCPSITGIIAPTWAKNAIATHSAKEWAPSASPAANIPGATIGIITGPPGNNPRMHASTAKSKMKRAVLEISGARLSTSDMSQSIVPHADMTWLNTNNDPIKSRRSQGMPVLQSSQVTMSRPGAKSAVNPSSATNVGERIGTHVPVIHRIINKTRMIPALTS